MTGTLLRCLRATLALGAVALALPISCNQRGGGVYVGGIQPSPAGRVNPFEPIENAPNSPR